MKRKEDIIQKGRRRRNQIEDVGREEEEEVVDVANAAVIVEVPISNQMANSRPNRITRTRPPMLRHPSRKHQLWTTSPRSPRKRSLLRRSLYRPSKRNRSNQKLDPLSDLTMTLRTYCSSRIRKQIRKRKSRNRRPKRTSPSTPMIS